VELMVQVCLLLAAIATLIVTLTAEFSVGLLHAPFVCGPIASSGFQHDFYMVCRHSTHNCSSSRQRNAVWLLEKARKVNTRMLASAVPEALWSGRCAQTTLFHPFDADVVRFSAAAVAQVVHEAWDVATGVGGKMSWGTQSRDHFPANAVSASAPNAALYAAAAGKVAVDDKENDRSRGIGDGMERLRLCVSLLQKQVHVGAQHSL
jgi:hypothetical protein